MVKSLSDLQAGETCTVTEINTVPRYTARLRDFGIVPGVTVICRYFSPGRHLMAIECGGAVIALRRTDTIPILVKN